MADSKKTCPFCGTFPTEEVKYLDFCGVGRLDLSIVCPKCKIKKTKSVKIGDSTTFLDIKRAMDHVIADWDQREG